MAQSRWKEIKDIILSQGAADARKLDPHEVRTGEWVRLKCQFGCGGYGSCLTCPPRSPTPEQTRRVLDSYTVGYLIYWGHESGGRKAVAEIERQVFLKGFYKAFAMASGPCELCEECNLDGDCRYPYEARPSMEACGIDVFQTAREAGFPIEVLTSYEDTPNFYSLLLVE
jgi:predicted metal-binding protein